MTRARKKLKKGEAMVILAFGIITKKGAFP